MALVLALDVSGSVDQTEYRQQLDGLAFALDSAAVREAILWDPAAPVRIAIFEWSSQNHQLLIQPWRALRTHGDIDALVGRVGGHQRRRAGLKTALGTALAYAGNLLDQQRECAELKVDVSGDGKNNIGLLPSAAHRLPAFSRAIVNALVIGDPSSGGDDESKIAMARLEMQAYYEENVTHGPGAFVLVASGYADYARAMRLKLLRELAAPALSRSDDMENVPKGINAHSDLSGHMRLRSDRE